MSKSLGNFFTVRDLLDQGDSGRGDPLCASDARITAARWTGRRRKPSRPRRRCATGESRRGMRGPRQVVPTADVVEALADDLNTPGDLARASCNWPSADQASRDCWHPRSCCGRAWTGSACSRRGAAWKFAGRSRLCPFAETPCANCGQCRDGVQGFLPRRCAEIRADRGRCRSPDVQGRRRLVPGPDFDPAKLEALVTLARFLRKFAKSYEGFCPFARPVNATLADVTFELNYPI